MSTLRTCLVLIASTFVAVPQASAIDLTGTWQGSSKCTAFDGSKIPIVHKGETLLILQTGSTLALSVSGFKSAGVVYPDDKKPDQKGQVGFVECSTTTVPDSSGTNQVGRLVAKTKPNSPKASVSWSSIFENANLAGTCKGTYKRVDTTPPVLSGCS